MEGANERDKLLAPINSEAILPNYGISTIIDRVFPENTHDKLRLGIVDAVEKWDLEQH